MNSTIGYQSFFKRNILKTQLQKNNHIQGVDWLLLNTEWSVRVQFNQNIWQLMNLLNHKNKRLPNLLNLKKRIQVAK